VTIVSAPLTKPPRSFVAVAAGAFGPANSADAAPAVKMPNNANNEILFMLVSFGFVYAKIISYGLWNLSRIFCGVKFILIA
jgi:hypothetical protein